MGLFQRPLQPKGNMNYVRKAVAENTQDIGKQKLERLNHTPQEERPAYRHLDQLASSRPTSKTQVSRAGAGFGSLSPAWRAPGLELL